MQKAVLKTINPTATLCSVSKEYLKKCRDRNERSLLKRFYKFMPKGTKIVFVTDHDFERFLKSLKLSPSTLENRQSILKRFKRHIGLDQTPPSRGGRKSRNKEFEPLKREWKKKESQLLDMIARRDQTIDTLYAEKKEMKKIIDMINSKRTSIQELENLETRIDELKKEEKSRKSRLRHLGAVCPLKNRIVSLSNDCYECRDNLSCGVYACFQYPEEE